MSLVFEDSLLPMKDIHRSPNTPESFKSLTGSGVWNPASFHDATIHVDEKDMRQLKNDEMMK
jgi:hypothetical protein